MYILSNTENLMFSDEVFLLKSMDFKCNNLSMNMQYAWIGQMSNLPLNSPGEVIILHIHIVILIVGIND